MRRFRAGLGGHEFADGIEDDGDGLVVGRELALDAGFEFIQALCC